MCTCSVYTYISISISNQTSKHIPTASLPTWETFAYLDVVFLSGWQPRLCDKHIVYEFRAYDVRMCNIFLRNEQSWASWPSDHLCPGDYALSDKWRLFHTIRLFNGIGSDCRFTNINFVFFWLVINIYQQIHISSRASTIKFRSSYKSILLFQFTSCF